MSEQERRKRGESQEVRGSAWQTVAEAAVGGLAGAAYPDIKTAGKAAVNKIRKHGSSSDDKPSQRKEGE